MSEMNPSVDFFNKYSPYFATLLTFILSMLFTLVPFWPLTFVAAIFGGFLCKNMNCGALSAMIGIIISWGIYIIIEVIGNRTNILFDQLGILITGSSGFGFWLIFIVLIVGAIIGLLGGTIGSGIRILIEPKFLSKKNHQR
ncbi:hypothetical protein DSAG12_02528 [Promethearchaeum syntrophicum]|uniref:Uncharacterized protein n=1 Tax=Promethearchaeum syntrophicum TaxID=2594042 RepID=A0A5B9DBX6_9ARCH|nr:hypothetical protein [Candidatus Prometheoarchaeum syntrophicum]QEE16698.1 hypothetical protein DSAG12_02528 [Candidatus Prometheoarchaeum syntrophicum]